MYESQVECADCGAVFTLEEHPYHVCASSQSQEIETASIIEESSSRNNSEENIVAKLAEAVQARPALWDHTLPLKKRGKDIRENMWREVYEDLNRVIALENLEKKWKNLKDTFLKHLKTYKPSGGGVDDQKKWKHFDCMYFLANINRNRKTFGNFEPVETDVDSSSSTSTDVAGIVDPLSPTPSTPKTTNLDTPSRSKRQKKSDETDQLLLEVLKQPIPARTEPAISPVLMIVQEVLSKLPERVRMGAEIDILNKVYQLHAEHSNP